MTAAKPDTPKTLPPHDPRFAGTTGYSPGKMLRLASYLGLAMGCGSIAMIAYTLLSWSMHSAVLPERSDRNWVRCCFSSRPI